MTEVRRTIPQPTPFQQPPVPAEVRDLLKAPAPSVLHVAQVSASGEPQLAIIFKRTYVCDGGRFVPAGEQLPLLDEAGPHQELTPGVPPSSRNLTEIVGFKTGTDVVVQGSARPHQPSTTAMDVAVQVGAHRHVAAVFGRRFCDYMGGKLVFTPPEPFEEIPLRYENAYGGRDAAAERTLLAEIERSVPPEDLRRARPSLEFIFSANNPLIYPRNRFGKGYVLDERPASVKGRELPNLERPDDLLTPDRLVVANPLVWAVQPVPIGFDFLDPISFPRSAMLGLPPPCHQGWNDCREVSLNLIPRDFCRGSFIAATGEQLADILHPFGSRCASLGLWLPFLRGDEPIQLEGMDPDQPVQRLDLPGETPHFLLRGAHSEESSPPAELHLVHLTMATGELIMVWVSRIGLRRPLAPGEDRQIASAIRTGMRKV